MTFKDVSGGHRLHLAEAPANPPSAAAAPPRSPWSSSVPMHPKVHTPTGR